jgi:hypothetical protein
MHIQHTVLLYTSYKDASQSCKLSLLLRLYDRDFLSLALILLAAYTTTTTVAIITIQYRSQDQGRVDKGS